MEISDVEDGKVDNGAVPTASMITMAVASGGSRHPVGVMRRGIVILVAFWFVTGCSSDATDGAVSDARTDTAVPAEVGTADAAPVVSNDTRAPAVGFCDAVLEHRRQLRGPDPSLLIPLPRASTESYLARIQTAFAEVVASADDAELQSDLERLERWQQAVDAAVLAQWGEDGVALLAAADVWGGPIVRYVVRDGIDVDGQTVARLDYEALRSDVFETVSLECDDRPSGWLRVDDLPAAAVPSDLRYAMVMKVSDRLQLMLGSTEVPVFPFPDMEFTNPLVSPDGRSIAAMGYGPGVLNSAFVGRFESLSDIQQVSPDAEAWNCLSWSADSRSLIVTRLVAPGKWKQSSYDVASGEIVDLFDTEFPSHAMPCGTFLDDDTLLVTEDDPETGLTVVSSQNVGSDNREVFVSIPDCTTIYPQVRPRTGEVAVIAGCANVYDSGLWIVPASGGAPRHVLNGLVAAPTWSPDGEWILFGFQEDRTSVPSLWIASPDGSTASELVGGWSSWPAWIPAETACGLCPT